LVKVKDEIGVLEGFSATVATEDKVVPKAVLSKLENVTELQIELHYKGFPPETRNVSIPSSNRLLIEKHLKQIWREQKPTNEPAELPAEIKIAP